MLIVWNEKKGEEFVFSLIFNMLGCWEKFLITFITSSLSRSTLQGRSVWRFSTIFSKWSLNVFAKSVSAVISSNYLTSSTRIIFSSLRILSIKLSLIVFQKCLLSVTFFYVEIIIEILFWSLEKFNAVVTLPFVCQLIFWATKFS